LTTSVIIPAAGSGVRLGENRPKAFVDVEGASILARTVASILAVDDLELDRIVVVVPAEMIGPVREELAGVGCEVVVVAGGAERSDSVRAGLQHVTGEFVLVHDAARPFTPVPVFRRVVAALRAGNPVVVPGLPVVDTLKRVDAQDRVDETVDRAVLRAIQTPQGFHADALVAAYAPDSDGPGTATDDAGLAERAGLPVLVVDGDPDAFKITTPWDLRLARDFAKGRA